VGNLSSNYAPFPTVGRRIITIAEDISFQRLSKALEQGNAVVFQNTIITD